MHVQCHADLQDQRTVVGIGVLVFLKKGLDLAMIVHQQNERVARRILSITGLVLTRVHSYSSLA